MQAIHNITCLPDVILPVFPSGTGHKLSRKCLPPVQLSTFQNPTELAPKINVFYHVRELFLRALCIQAFCLQDWSDVSAFFLLSKLIIRCEGQYIYTHRKKLSENRSTNTACVMKTFFNPQGPGPFAKRPGGGALRSDIGYLQRLWFISWFFY